MARDSEENNKTYNEQKQRAQDLRDSAVADQKRWDEINKTLNAANPGQNTNDRGSGGGNKGGGGGSGGGCFIATAVFESAEGPELDILRAFRDRRLLTTPAGRLFVRCYYRFGPGCAGAIAKRPRLKTAVRVALERWCAYLDRRERHG